MSCYRRFREDGANDSNFENAIESLASNENLTEAVSDLKNLANADLSALNDQELCRLFRFLSCYFCRR
ncbi:hypothetical protein [Caproicibacter fermentans]|uniref:Uncharacterized protein n=1 Tax=Caproicibacter fermentans TaxID=2576756 RepID=A0A7G8TBL4_9FIRM|nr:hypothetical protein [Caproicibacter fermentans]QNK41005.1 hypothetical protein HCR03_01390 [Caproicibacter fermentans]